VSPNRAKHNAEHLRLKLQRAIPTFFNPWYEIKGKAIQDQPRSSDEPHTFTTTGPQMKALQWEANAIRRTL
jgi:hypothetical protein